MFHSPSHTFMSAEPELLSFTENSYFAVFIKNPKSNTSTIRFGGPEITSTTGGEEIDRGDGFWISIAGRLVRLNEMWVCGTPGETVDTICVPPVT